jgi:hypothetical protein
MMAMPYRPIAKSLQYATQDDEVVGRARRRDRGSDEENHDDEKEGQALPERLDQPCVEQLADCHSGDERRCHPLREVQPDAVGAHDARHRDIDDRHRQHHRHDAEHAGEGDEIAVMGTVPREAVFDRRA